MKRPLRHPKDPKGFVAVRTPPRIRSSCPQCALRRHPLKMCHSVPCLSIDRPDGAEIHYVKKRKK